MSEITQDVQCKKILRGIGSLLSLLKEELVENILEIGSNVESKEYFNLLKRIERSVDQYVKRDKNLFYIGFLGHYSSGKSSTINSILKLKGSSAERPVNINPTDDQITLITNPVNNEQIVKLIRVGKVPVVLSAVDNVEFLNDKIIMDTPGSGDPALVEEIVRDSLPLCDIIVYCISAANPLDNSDIPLLTEKETNLSQIPTIYIITRGNEFKKDHLKALVSDNFDVSGARMALSQLASRMHEIVDTINLEYENFIVIDNKEHFNIDKLVDAISGYTDKTDHANILNLHSHKVDFFIRMSGRIKAHFTNLIFDKLSTMESFVSKAQSNIDEYNQRTLIGSDKLINEWRNYDDRIKQITEGSIYENNRLHQTLETSHNFMGLPTVEEWITRSKSAIKYSSQTISDDGKSLLSNHLYDLKEKYKEKLFSYTGKDNSIRKDEVSSFLQSLKIQLPVTVTTPFNYQTEFNSFFSTTINYLTSQRYEYLKRAFDSLSNRTRNKNPLDSIQKHIDDAKLTMAEIFESYNEAVKIYRVAAFSSEAKNYIRKLGLSLKLDKLDTETINIQDYHNRAQQEIFDKYQDEIVDFKNGCLRVEQLVSEAKIDYPIFTSHNKESELEILIANYIKGLNIEIEKEADDILHKSKNLLVDLIDEINSERLKFTTRKRNDLKVLRGQRIKFYLVRYIPTLLVLVFTVALFLYPRWFSFINSELTLGWQWTLGILSNIAFAAISTLFIRAKDKFPARESEISTKYIKDERQLISETVDKSYYSINSDLVSEFKNHVQLFINEKATKNLLDLTSIKFGESLHESHKIVCKCERKLKQAIEAYSALLSNLKSTISSILNNNKANKEVITQQSFQIMENSINPSFDLLFKTKNDIISISKSFSKIDFQN